MLKNGIMTLHFYPWVKDVESAPVFTTELNKNFIMKTNIMEDRTLFITKSLNEKDTLKTAPRKMIRFSISLFHRVHFEVSLSIQKPKVTK